MLQIISMYCFVMINFVYFMLQHVVNMLQHVVNMLQHVVNMLQHDDATITIYNSGQLLTFLKGTVHSQRTKWSKI